MALKVDINTRNMDLNDKLQEYVQSKVSKLDRYLDLLEEAQVDLTFAKSARSASDRQVAQVTLRGKGVLLRAEERSDDILASVDAVMDKMYRQIERYKGRRFRGRGDGRSAADVALELASSGVEDSPTEAEYKVVRRKRFSLTPMDEAEALEQMELLSHEDFFVFLNADTGQVNVLYRRRDGLFGLIETEVG
jgi:putative sigma-54 modulation protein